MRALKIGLLTLALGAAALPAAAQSWGVSDKPAATDNGQWMCMLWHGTTAPMMNITMMTDRNFISVVGSQFAAVPDRAEAQLAYASGRTGNGVIRKSEQQPNAVFLYFPDEALDTILDQFRTPGTFTLSAGEASASFPVPEPGLGTGIVLLKECAGKFPETSE
ncbi:MAG: hypothetical protein CVT79_07765 [Alphaproteobacteria bacterium HGW-Alphaproteobacteria-18]|nr:MAG: hypothetical protein CVT79_07765 [Alphaproteobacteria bacterium HGW-Alphaproteobacteria-18]